MKSIAVAISVIGLLLSAYLTIVYLFPGTLACPSKGVIDCVDVLTSQYSTIFGIPNAVLGMVFFIAETAVVVRYFGKDQMVVMNGVGMAFVLYYIYAEYMLRSICIYCTGVHICVAALLIISIKWYGK